MKIIVVYNSKTGFTKKYGEWIGQELGCKAVPINKADYSNCDLIIYGGWMMASKIAGLDKIKNNASVKGKKLIVYATGMTGQNEEKAIEKIKNDNLTAMEQKEIPFYYFEGGIDYKAMGFFSKMIMKMMYKSLAKKQDRTADETNMMNALATSADHCNRTYTKTLIEYVKGL